jgi:myb proto-oncogene protein
MADHVTNNGALNAVNTAAAYNAATKKNGSPVTPKTDAMVPTSAMQASTTTASSVASLVKPTAQNTATSSAVAPGKPPTKKKDKSKKAKNRKRSQKARWTGEEDKLLRSLVKVNDAKNWKKISESFPERTDVQCLHRWQKVLNPNLIKVRERNA